MNIYNGYFIKWPKTRYICFDFVTKRQIAYSCVALWNTEVPDNQQNEIKQITVQKSFAKKYKTYLLNLLHN